MNKCLGYAVRRNGLAGAAFVFLTLTGCAARDRVSPDLGVKQEIPPEVRLGTYRRYVRGGVSYVTGPEKVVQFIRREAAAGKRQLRKMLDSSERHIQYFSIIALGQIGDWEARDILKAWAVKNAQRDPEAASLAAARLIWMNDFRAYHVFEGLPPRESFATRTVVMLGRHKLGLDDLETPGSGADWERTLERIRSELGRLVGANPSLLTVY